MEGRGINFLHTRLGAVCMAVTACFVTGLANFAVTDCY